MGELCDQCQAHAEAWRNADVELPSLRAFLDKFEARRAPVERPCSHCGKEMADLGSRADRKYCSGACRVAAHRKQHRPAARRGECRPCEWCEVCLRRHRPDAKYCSARCKQAAYRAWGGPYGTVKLIAALEAVTRDSPEGRQLVAELEPAELFEAAKMAARMLALG